MPACVFNTCCGCIELRTGCLIIAYINLVCEIILIALGLLTLIGGSALAAGAEDTEAKQAGAAMLALSVIMLLVVFFLLAFTIVLLVGVHQNKRGHVKAYLIYSYIFLVLSIIGFFAGFGGTIVASEVVKNLITILLCIYFTLVIRSFYHKMDDKRPQVYNAA